MVDNMLNLIWQLGILSVVLLFGVKIGLAMGFSGLSKKVAVVIAAGYGLGIYILSFIISRYTSTFYNFISDYNSAIFLIMALIIIYTGLYTIKEWKIHQKNHAKATCAAMIAPSPCCFGMIGAAIIMISPIIGASSVVIGQYAGVFLSLTILIVYFASEAITRITKKPYPLLLGNFMLFAGFYFIASVIVIPNINKVLESPMSPMNIPSSETLTYVSIFAIILIFSGFYVTKKRSSLVQK
jgi:predicted transporter